MSDLNERKRKLKNAIQNDEMIIASAMRRISKAKEELERIASEEQAWYTGSQSDKEASGGK